MFEWLDFGALTCVYFALVGIGVVYALIILIGGGLSEIHLPDLDLNIGDIDLGGVDIPDASVHLDVGGDVDINHGEVSVRSLSPVAVAAFVTSFGAIGIVGIELLGLSGPWSLLVAVGGALVVAVIAQVAYSVFLIAPQGSSEVRVQDIIGALGEVTTPIAPGKTGEVAFVARGSRVTSAARSADGSPMPRGTIVRVSALVGSVVLVAPLESHSQERQDLSDR